MKVSKINYQRVFSMSNYENKKVGIEIELNNGDTVERALKFAIEFVECHNPSKIVEVQNANEEKLMKEFEYKINCPEEYTEAEIIEAIKIVRKKRKEDLPF